MTNRLHVLRAERRWSQAELARRVHVSRQTIVSLENGRYEPTLKLALRLVVFGRPVEEVFTADPEDLALVDLARGNRRAPVTGGTAARRRSLTATRRSPPRHVGCLPSSATSGGVP